MRWMAKSQRSWNARHSWRKDDNRERSVPHVWPSEAWLKPYTDFNEHHATDRICDLVFVTTMLCILYHRAFSLPVRFFGPAGGASGLQIVPAHTRASLSGTQ